MKTKPFVNYFLRSVFIQSTSTYYSTSKPMFVFARPKLM